MSKIFQIEDNFCFRDYTDEIPDLEYASTHFAPNIIFVEAPDYVFVGWGFDKYQEGDARFVKPDVPEGWVYNELDGTFYPKEHEKYVLNPNYVQDQKELRFNAQLQAVSDRQEFIEDCIAEMAMMVYNS